MSGFAPDRYTCAMKHALKSAAILLALTATGCSSGARIAKTNDKLRLERETLREQIEQLESENAELEAKVSELSRQSDASPSDDIIAALPRVASIELTRFCSVWTEGGASEARFFLVPKDGRGRFVQAVGKAGVTVADYGELAEPIELEGIERNEKIEPIGMRTLSALELRDSFVSGLSGSSYMINVPLTETPSSGVIFSAWFEDAITGELHRVGRLVEVSH
ncbi:MAG: hypothetical protein ED559_11905 [Phycisphaera sp.]|nr:MAG: hypothetical protein ED559_11905 [Phycisphaera sp.]